MFNKRESRIKKIFNAAKPFLVSAAVVGTTALAVSKRIEKNNDRMLDMRMDKENKLFIKGSELMETLELLRQRQRDEEETYRQVKEKMNTTQRSEAESLLNKYQSLIEKMSYQLNELNKYAYKNPNEYGLRITKSKKAYEKFNEVLSEVNLLLNNEVKGLVRGSNKIMQILEP